METIEQARLYLRENLNTGTTCPCCKQMVKLYKRKITGVTAAGLTILYRNNKRVGFMQYVSVPELLTDKKYTDVTKLYYWDLIEPLRSSREDGSKRVGMWRMTQKGIDFVEGKIAVDKNVFVYNNKVYRRSEEKATIRDCFGLKFNYEELMSDVKEPELF